MKLVATRWLIELPGYDLPERQFLHVFDDGAIDFSPDRTRALRFATSDDAILFACQRRLTPVRVSEHPADDLVGAVEQDFGDEFDGQVDYLVL